MKTVQKMGYAAFAVMATGIQSVLAQGRNGNDFFGWDKLNGNKIVGSGNALDKSAENLINNAMLFLAILAVLYGLYGWFLMLTAGGEDDKVSKGKKILIQVILGLVVIFLAGSLVKWVLALLQNV